MAWEVLVYLHLRLSGFYTIISNYGEKLEPRLHKKDRSINLDEEYIYEPQIQRDNRAKTGIFDDRYIKTGSKKRNRKKS